MTFTFTYRPNEKQDPMLACGEVLDRWAAMYGIKRRERESDDTLRARLKTIVVGGNVIDIKAWVTPKKLGVAK